MKKITLLWCALLIGYAFGLTPSPDDKNEVETEKPSVVSRLDPILKKALLQALTNLESESSDEDEEESEENSQVSEQPTTTTDDELLEESTTSDQDTAIQYHTFSAANEIDGNDSNENEIIKTIVVKNSRTTPLPENEAKPEKKIKDVIIRFDNLDPVKESDIRVETIQIARSVPSSNGNKIDDETTDQKTEKKKATSDKKITSKPTTTTTTTTTEGPTHNEDGENIEKVQQNDVKIYQAPLVTAFTIQQDEQGMPQNVIPILKAGDKVPPVSRPIEEFILPVQPLSGPNKPSQIQSRMPIKQTAAPITYTLQKSQPNQSSIFNSFALEQKQKQLEQQIYVLQAQQRQQEELFRQQQLFHDQQALQRQQQLLLEQRQKLEEEYRFRQEKYEQELQRYRQQQQQSHQQIDLSQQQSQIQQLQNKPQSETQNVPLQDQSKQTQFSNDQQLSQQHQLQQQQQFNQQQQSRFNQQQQSPPIFNNAIFNQPQHQIPTTVQIVPSVSFGTTVPLSTQQLLPARDAIEFRTRLPGQQQQHNAFPFNHLIPPNPPQLAPLQQLPLRPFQTFNNVPLNRNQFLDPVAVAAESANRNRVFRQETETANAGLNYFNNNNNNNNNVPSVNHADNYLQNLLFQSGISGRQNEDLNIITKVLALNHGISAPPTNFIPLDSRRYARSNSDTNITN